MLKLAGWDGVVVVGKAESPVHINIVDDKVTLEDAKGLWGLTTWTRGKHSFKTGGEVRRSKSVQTRMGSGSFVNDSNVYPEVVGGATSFSPASSSSAPTA